MFVKITPYLLRVGQRAAQGARVASVVKVLAVSSWQLEFRSQDTLNTHTSVTAAPIEFFLLFSREELGASGIARTVTEVVMYHPQWILLTMVRFYL